MVYIVYFILVNLARLLVSVRHKGFVLSHVARRLRDLRLQVESILEDGLDALLADGAVLERASAGGL